MSNETTKSSGSLGFCGLLTIVFIVLKLLGKIDWSWWWVLAPSWIPLLLAFLAVIVGALYAYEALLKLKKK